MTGKRVRRTAVIGTFEQYPTKEEALHAVNGLRMQVNADRNRRPVHPLLIADVIDHYVRTELSPNADWHSHATRIAYRYFMKKWIQPHWGKMSLARIEAKRQAQQRLVQNSLRRERWIGTRDPGRFRCRNIVIATLHGPI